MTNCFTHSSLSLLPSSSLSLLSLSSQLDEWLWYGIANQVCSILTMDGDAMPCICRGCSRNWPMGNAFFGSSLPVCACKIPTNKNNLCCVSLLLRKKTCWNTILLCTIPRMASVFLKALFSIVLYWSESTTNYRKNSRNANQFST